MNKPIELIVFFTLAPLPQTDTNNHNSILCSVTSISYLVILIIFLTLGLASTCTCWLTAPYALCTQPHSTYCTFDSVNETPQPLNRRFFEIRVSYLVFFFIIIIPTVSQWVPFLRFGLARAFIAIFNRLPDSRSHSSKLVVDFLLSFIFPHLDRSKIIIDEVNFLTTRCNYTRFLFRIFFFWFCFVFRILSRSPLEHYKMIRNLKKKNTWTCSYILIRFSIQVLSLGSVFGFG